MRNNLILIIILNLSFICKSFAIEGFSIFESKFIEYQESNNKIIGKGEVKIETFDNVIILSDDAVLDRINNTLVLTGNVKVLDSINKIFLESKRIEYDKKINLFYSKDKTLIDLQNSYKIESSNISFNKNKNIIKSEKPTKLIDVYGNIIYLNNFNYSIDEKKLKAKSINFKDKNNNKFKTADSIIATEKKNLIIAAKDIELYLDQNNNFGENARIKGNSVIKNEKLTKVKKGIFTSCEPRNGCPPWSIEAEEIIHNKEKKIINYKNAWLRIYNKPILYFPRFFHPDPTVERQSGFLVPSLSPQAHREML
jgi:LPS-assembly protein